MTLLIPLLLRLTSLFERGVRVDEVSPEDHDASEESVSIIPEEE